MLISSDFFFFFQAEDGIRDRSPSRGLGDVYKRQEEGRIAVGDKFRLTVDADRRHATQRNHSATHLLQQALRKVLGEHVEQKGSLVSPTELRFDFSHSQAMTTEQIARVEDLVNEQILANTATKAEVLPLEEARKTGATMLFLSLIHI